MDRRFNEDPDTFTHEYETELAIFQDYVRNRKTAAQDIAGDACPHEGLSL